MSTLMRTLTIGMRCFMRLKTSLLAGELFVFRPSDP